MATTDFIDAVAYYRMSDAQQELSIEQQKPLVHEHAKKNGYRIIREYQDAGKSGSKNREKRVQFDKLINDAEGNRDHVAVLCWDTARFTRQDSQEAANDKMRLRRAGVHILDTVSDGRYDWNTTEGRMMDAFRTEGNNAAAIKISQQTTRGREHYAKLGWWTVGTIPYGFDRLYTDGTHTITVRRTDRSFKKGRNWHLKLVKNPEEAKIVEEIFNRVYAEGIPLRALANELTLRKVPSPDPQKGKAMGWTKDTIKGIIYQKAYIGIGHIGTKKRRGSRQILNKTTATEKEGACEKIIDAVLFKNVHDALAKKNAERRRPQFHKSAVLSGFVVCGHCGYRMEKKVLRGKVTFTCGSANKRSYLGCRQWRAYEEKLLPESLAWLAKELDFEILKALQAKPKEKPTTQEADLEAAIMKLTTKFKNATESALQAPQDAREQAWAIVTKWQAELETAKTELQAIRNARNDPALSEFGKWWDEQKANLERIEQELAKCKKTELGKGAGKTNPLYTLYAADRNKLREMMTKIGFEIRIWWRHEPEARKKNRSAFEWVQDRQQISVKVPLKSENSSANPSS